MEKIPGINNHNDFAKIIKKFFHDDFVFSASDSASDSDCWYEKLKINLVEYDWVEITSCKFKNTVFKKMENLKNISLDIFILIRILKNWKGYFQFTGVYL